MKDRLVMAASMSAMVALVAFAGVGAHAPGPAFTLSSPDLAGNTFGAKYILNGFGCSGGNTSPALVWSNLPAGTKSLALQVHDPDAPTGGGGWWHWAVVDISADTVMIEISGREQKIDSFIDLMRPYGIVELARTGRIALVRGTPGSGVE